MSEANGVVFMVVGSCGSNEDYREWVAGESADKEVAEAWARALMDGAKQMRLIRQDAYIEGDQEWYGRDGLCDRLCAQMKKHDPLFDQDYGDADYEVRDVRVLPREAPTIRLEA